MPIIKTLMSSVRHKPRYLPTINSPRPIGFEKIAKTVRRSISLETKPTPTNIEINTPNNKIALKPRLTIVRASCPAVNSPRKTALAVISKTNSTRLYKTRSRTASRNVLRAIIVILLNIEKEGFENGGNAVEDYNRAFKKFPQFFSD